jgi:hypothetical protein
VNIGWQGVRWAGLALGLIAGAFGLVAASNWRLERLATRALLPTRFEHAAHKTVACTTCHHNFVGERLGGKRCLACHKGLTRTEGMRIDTLFHDFCTSCHRSERAAGRKSGPVKACASCHIAAGSATFRIERIGRP